MFYERKIKYLDYMVEGVRQKNAGFWKIEVRNAVCNMTIQITGLRQTDSLRCPVYFIAGGREQEACEAELVGGCGVVRLLGEKRNNLKGTNISYEALEGVRIPLSQGREIRGILRGAVIAAEGLSVCAAGRREATREVHAEEESLTAEQTRAPEERATAEQTRAAEERATAEKTRAAEERATTEQTRATEESATTEQNREREQSGRAEEETAEEALERMAEEIAREALEKMTAGGGKEGEKKSEKKCEMPGQGTAECLKKERVIERNSSDKGKQKNALTREKAAGREEAEREEAEREAAEREEDNLEWEEEVEAGAAMSEWNGGKQAEKGSVKTSGLSAPHETKWKHLWAIYPHLTPFQDEREFLSISPSDFVVFPSKYYGLANNSFLLHGYYNYRHLVLKRLERRGEAIYYLGVPGTFFNREKQVAVMFGFECFECKEEPAGAGDYGYYFIRVDL